MTLLGTRLLRLLLRFLTLRESSALYNVALFKPAFQGSLWPPYTANLGNDGQVQSDFYVGNCMHTDLQENPWWMVDLSGQHRIEGIVFTNRLDVNAQRLSDFTIDVFSSDPRISGVPSINGTVCYSQSEPLLDRTYTWNCTSPVVGRYVRIIMYKTEYLHFCEMQVLASETFYQEAIFVGLNNVPLASTSVTSVRSESAQHCCLLCLVHRDSDACTSYKWFPANFECQLITVDPYSTTFYSAMDTAAQFLTHV